ncbi:MAG: ATP-binding protein, partial [Desulfocapsaceae bacterium]|nr:ATP-binding protein [Desulfocapsaceae bacterium]
KGSQKKLKTITAFTDLLVASMPLGIVALDADGIIKTCNSSASKMLDLDHRAVGKHYSNAFPENLIQQFAVLISRKTVMSETDIVIEKPGVPRNFHIMCVPLFPADETDSGQMLLIQDMTTQKNLESELRRNERHTALGKMAAGVAHELRNPLSSIKGLALLLKSKTEQQSPDSEAAEILISEVERLDRSISELLDYSRPEHLRFAEIELLLPITKAIRLIRSDAAAEQINIIEAYEDENQLIKGDPDKLTQLFLNLFLNSLQAMTSGGTLRVATNREGGKFIITVDDSGAGIDEKVREKIFDPYFTTKNEGTGLGLSLCAKIVEDHQGTISIVDRNGSGTRVTITLPA